MSGLLWFQSTDEYKQYFGTSAIKRIWLENFSDFSCWLLIINTKRVNCRYSYWKRVAKFKIAVNGNRDVRFSPSNFMQLWVKRSSWMRFLGPILLQILGSAMIACFQKVSDLHFWRLKYSFCYNFPKQESLLTQILRQIIHQAKSLKIGKKCWLQKKQRASRKQNLQGPTKCCLN